MNQGYFEVRDGGAGLIDLSERGRIRVSGSEAVMFLNGLITNDMKTLVAHRWMPAASFAQLILCFLSIPMQPHTKAF